MPEPEPGTVPPEVMPEEVQLETPPARIISSAASSNALRPRLRANGMNTSPQANGRAGHESGGELFTDAAVSPVAICTVTFTVVLAGMISLAGLKVQDEFAGSEPHWKVNTPWKLRPGIDDEHPAAPQIDSV